MAEILIPIPPWLVDGLMDAKLYCETALLLCRESVLSIVKFLQQQNNGLWFLFSLVVFWPLWVYFAVAITTAWAWMFWLLASVCLGIIQVVYVSYQFVMIVVDVMVLTLFKTYQVVMRSTVINFFFGVFSSRIRKSRQRTSRRRQWRSFCESAKSYADFKFIEVMEPKPPLTVKNGNKEGDKQKQQQQIQGIGSFRRERRSLSFASLPVLKEEAANPLSASTSNLNSPQRRSLSRLGSFGSTSSATSPLAESSVAGSPAVDPNIVQDLGQMTADLLQSTTDRLHEARQLYVYNGDQSLQFLLSGVVKRNHLTLEDLLVSDGRSVAYSGQHEFSEPTRAIIGDYYEAVSKGISCMAEAPAASVDDPLPDLRERITLVRKMKHNTGRTALMLSGGGAQAMYHLGTVRALIEGNLYDDIKVISGTSGGSITAAMCALKTAKELYDDVCVPTVSTDYLHSGEMKEKNIRWFPPVMDMGTYWLKHKLLVDSDLFRRTCEFYYADTTFAEAFERTGKHVCITVSASRASGGTAQRLLLNHIATPHVTLASAVAASCALPGVMKPAKLQTKNSNGELESFEVDGVEWIDGSVQADLPFQRISTMFNVSNFIVCQTNFHVVPFMNKEHHPNKTSAYWRLFQTMEWDIRNRALKLGRLGLFPRLFGQDMSKVFKQKYHGNLTLIPRFTAMQTFGLKALVNPTVRDVEGYLKYGQIAAWPFLSVIKDMIRLESALDACLERLKERCSELQSDDWALDDDLDSIASSTTSVTLSQQQQSNHLHLSHHSNPRVVRFAKHDREVERLKTKMTKVEQENLALKQQLEQMQSLLVQQGGGSNSLQQATTGEEKKLDPSSQETPLGSREGQVWNLVHQLGFDDK